MAGIDRDFNILDGWSTSLQPWHLQHVSSVPQLKYFTDGAKFGFSRILLMFRNIFGHGFTFNS